MTTEASNSSLQHLLAHLERIELLVRAQIVKARQVYETDKNTQGLYISEEEIDALLKKPMGLPQWATDPALLPFADVRAALDRLADNITDRKEEAKKRGISFRLDELQRLFELTPFEIDVLLLCLAPELDLRYERLYAYLQDDITKKQPSVDLALNLLAASFEAKIRARQCFALNSTLLKNHLIQMFEDPAHHHPPLLSKFLKLDDRVASYLLDGDGIDERILPYTRYVHPQVQLEGMVFPVDFKDRLSYLVKECQKNSDGLILYFQGPYGVGKQTTAEALCRENGMGLLIVDGEHLTRIDEMANFETTVRRIIREASLQQAALYLTDFDALLADDKHAHRAILLRELDSHHGVTFCAGETTWEPEDALHNIPFLQISFQFPSVADRRELWARSLDSSAERVNEVDVEALATKFRFTGGQIQDAAATTRNLARGRNAQDGHVTMADLYEACRLQSNRKLAILAQKITPHYKWDDIILPEDRIQQLREICSNMKYRSLVYDEWGFDRKLALGKGLNVLFAGPSGTGKTMAAEIIAGELGQEMYKIDLSLVVSKYIGETEKNLSRIFAEAETSNSILFFDEADALFGKRSEVRDAHDRYANIETAYLLQKVDEYQGVVILATNFRKNMDEAFVRRLHITIEFPFPSAKDRCRIWERMWPVNTPRSTNLNLDFLAHRFEMTGGNIRNVALAAAFLAADNGKIVTMEHLFHATRREYQKMGKVVAEGEFQQHPEVPTTTGH